MYIFIFEQNQHRYASLWGILFYFHVNKAHYILLHYSFSIWFWGEMSWFVFYALDMFWEIHPYTDKDYLLSVPQNNNIGS